MRRLAVSRCAGTAVPSLSQMARPFEVYGLTILLSLCISLTASAEARFMGLGDLAGGVFLSEALAISADGSVVVGLGSSASGLEAFRWTSGGGKLEACHDWQSEPLGVEKSNGP